MKFVNALIVQIYINLYSSPVVILYVMGIYNYTYTILLHVTLRGQAINIRGRRANVLICSENNKMILIFSGKNKLVWWLVKKIKILAFWAILTFTKFEKKEMVVQSANKIIWFVAKGKKINNSEVKTLPSPLDIKWSAP